MFDEYRKNYRETYVSLGACTITPQCPCPMPQYYESRLRVLLSAACSPFLVQLPPGVKKKGEKGVLIRRVRAHSPRPRCRYPEKLAKYKGNAHELDAVSPCHRSHCLLCQTAIVLRVHPRQLTNLFVLALVVWSLYGQGGATKGGCRRSVKPIPAKEGRHLHLFVVTHVGVHLTHFRRPTWIYNDSPHCLGL